MTKAEKLQYLQDYVASQGTQAGLSIAALHNIPKVFISGAVLTFAQLEVTEDVVNGSVSVAGGSYALTLSKEAGQSKVVYTAG